jgi:hypothetical protein
VRAELRDMAEARVSRLTKSLAFSTLSALATASHDAGNDLRREGNAIEPAFASTAFARRDAAEGVPLEIDDSTRVRALTSAETEHLRSGRPLLVLTAMATTCACAARAGAPPVGRPSMPTAWARVSPAILWTESRPSPARRRRTVSSKCAR